MWITILTNKHFEACPDLLFLQMLQIDENGKNANTEKTVDEKSKLYAARHVLFRAGAVQQAGF